MHEIRNSYKMLFGVAGCIALHFINRNNIILGYFDYHRLSVP